MKKQILILVLAIFAIGFSSTAFGQLAPRVPNCIDLTDPLNVVPGQPYTYEVNVPTPPGDKTYHWFVTQDVSFITGAALNPAMTIQAVGGPILAAGTNYNAPANTINTVTLTFQSFVLNPGEYVFLGILVTNTSADPACPTNNFKVYRIMPQHAFTLDIANVNATGGIQPNYGTDGLTTCMADILTASYNAGATAITYDFNENALYFAVAAANFSDRYQLTMRILAANGLQSSQTVTIDTVHFWGNPWVNVVPAGAGNGDYPLIVLAKNATGSVGTAGETVYIRVLIDHGTQFEGNIAADIPFDFHVEGALGAVVGGVFTPDPARHDIHHDGPAGACPQNPFDDIATQYIVPRPTITSVSPAAPGNYLPIAP